MYLRLIPVVLLAACATDAAPDESAEFTYILGVDDQGDVVEGGAHHVVSFDTQREATDYANAPSEVHQELVGDYTTWDPTRLDGESDWDVFASSWWPQTNNGAAWRWAGSGGYSDTSDTDGLSPIEKYDKLFNPGQQVTVASVEHWNFTELDTPEADRGPKHGHPEVTALGPATEWELKNHGVYQGYHPEGWWGHCNGWASYATTEAGGAPQRDIRVKIVGDDVVECGATDPDCVLVRKGDIEALMSELYFNDTATFAGRRCEERPSDIDYDADGRPTDVACRDLNPATFHITAVGLLDRGASHHATGQQMKPAFIIDHNYDYEVWNFPVVEYEITDWEEVTEADATALVGTGTDYTWNAAATRFIRVATTYWMVSDSVSASAMLQRADLRNVPLHPVDLHYVLELDDDGTIVGGEWIEEPGTSWGDDSRTAHPDFIWMGVDPSGYYEDGDDLGGTSDNPYLAYSDVRALLDCANDPATCDDDTGDTGNPGGSDDGSTPSSGGTPIDCGGCAGRLHGPTGFEVTLFGALGGFLLRRRRRFLPRLPL